VRLLLASVKDSDGSPVGCTLCLVASMKVVACALAMRRNLMHAMRLPTLQRVGAPEAQGQRFCSDSGACTQTMRVGCGLINLRGRHACPP
jgi:hypothetical protein